MGPEVLAVLRKADLLLAWIEFHVQALVRQTSSATSAWTLENGLPNPRCFGTSVSGGVLDMDLLASRVDKKLSRFVS